MNGINIELLNKINKLDKIEAEILLDLLKNINQAKSQSEKKEVQFQFRKSINQILYQQE